MAVVERLNLNVVTLILINGLLHLLESIWSVSILLKMPINLIVHQVVKAIFWGAARGCGRLFLYNHHL